MCIKKQLKLSVVAAVVLGICGWLVALFTVRAADSTPLQRPQLIAMAAKPVQSPAPAHPPVTVAKAATSSPGVLDERHQFALGMIETGNDDTEVGGAGEVSRYQIMPSVWRHYSGSVNYDDPQVSLQVARRHWASLYDNFKQQAHRNPTDFDMYVLWNTRHGYYASRHFNPALISPVVRDRARRYVNLVEDGEI